LGERVEGAAIVGDAQRRDALRPTAASVGQFGRHARIVGRGRLDRHLFRLHAPPAYAGRMPEPDATPPHMSSAELRRHGHEAVDLIADYLEQLERGAADGGQGGWPVQSKAVPGEILASLPASPPE